MSSLLSRIFGRGQTAGGRHAVPKPSRREPRTLSRAEFSYSDTATWTFPHRDVSSSNLRSVAYDEPEEVMEIIFREPSRNHSGVYRYSGVPRRVFDGLISAPSKGQYFWRHIRDVFVYSDVG